MTDRAYNKRYYAANRETERARATAWASKNPERRAATTAAWRKANKDRVNENVKRWQRENAEKYARIHYKAMLRQRCKKFGITIDDYFGMLIAQAGACKLCGRNELENGRDLAIDHCHATGKVRGLLCHPCNTVLGHVQDDAALLQKMIEYIKRS